MGGQRICVGVITGAHGLRGQVRVRSFTENPADLAAYGPLGDETGERRFSLRVSGNTTKGQVLAWIEGVTDRTAAEALKGRKLYISRQTLPPPADDEFYYADLVGLNAELTDGSAFGSVRAVHEYGAGDMLEVIRTDGSSLFVPFTGSAVPTVDLAAGRLVIDPPAGLLEPGEPEPAVAGDAETTGKEAVQ